ncbi:MAG: hypothetical protein LBT48_01600 [Prevotellaceae bacterium]|jgi:hypothetical protein|nr:hypothetical protein [Prevotellaceae bacterium]
MKANTLKIGILLIAAQVAATLSVAQTRHQFSIDAAGGLSTLSYHKPAAGENGTGFGGSFGVGYTFFFSENFGVHIGAAAALIQSNYELRTVTEAYPTDGFQYNYTAENYHETRQAIFLNIPLMLRFESGWFYASAGVKAGIPLHAGYKNEVGNLRAFGYYPEADLTLYDPAFMGFGRFTDISNKGDLELTPAFFAAVEAGVKWTLSAKLSLYTGLYLDYGVNNIRNTPPQEQKLIPYNSTAPSDYRPNSVLTSSVNGASLADKITPLAAGIKIGVAFGTK